MPTPVASYFVKSGGSNTTALTTPSFTPAAGEIIVVKRVSENSTNVFAAPSGGGLTFNLHDSDATGSHVWASIHYATVGSSPTAMTVSSGTVTGNCYHSMTVERYSNAQLAATPAKSSPHTGTGAPLATIVTAAANSIVSLLNGDWNAVGGARTYRSGATEEGSDQDGASTNYIADFAYQTAATAGSQTIGLTAPTGQAWTLLGIEIQAAGGGSAFSGSVGLSGSGSLSLTGKPAETGSVALSGSGSLTTTGTPSASGSVALAGSGTLATSGSATASGSVALSGSGGLSLSGNAAASGGLNLSGSGSLAASGSQQSGPAYSGSIALSGGGVLSFTGKAATSGAVGLSGAGTLTTTGQASTSGTVALMGSGTLAYSAAVNAAGVLALTGTGTLTASGVAAGMVITPAERITVIPAEQRLTRVAAESRVTTIPAESRVTEIR